MSGGNGINGDDLKAIFSVAVKAALVGLGTVIGAAVAGVAVRVFVYISDV